MYVHKLVHMVTALYATIDTRIHNELETQYILQLQARYGHVITFMGHRCVSNRHNTYIFVIFA